MGVGEIKPWKAGDGPVSVYLNRKISWRITRTILKYRIPLTPNKMSVISFLTGVLAAPFYVLHMPIIGGILAQLSSILDGVDGELARALNMCTRSGAFFDTVLDRFVDFLIVVGLTYFTAQIYPNPTLVYVLGFLVVTGTYLCSYVHIAFRAYCSKEIPRFTKIPHIASRDIRLFVVFLGSILGLYLETLIVLAAITYMHTLLRFVDLFYRFRRVELQGGEEST
ncbi:MAG: CDP-alcohol phosphatidyltransferase family protein [Thermoproteales archaeon]|nr:CDP-alcohol phosphatidyltransferase family protein [Thermoproteales archaeon]